MRNYIRFLNQKLTKNKVFIQIAAQRLDTVNENSQSKTKHPEINDSVRDVTEYKNNC